MRARSPDRVLNAQDWASLDRPLRAAGADPAVATPRLKAFAGLVLEWNSGVSNLLSRNDEQRIVSRHILESLEPAAWMLELRLDAVVDFGSGAGFPALPLAIAGIGGHWALVESRRNKTLFMRKAVEALGLDNIRVICSRLEDLVAESEHAGAYDALTSRATAKIPETLALASRLIRPGGNSLLWKGSGSVEELAGDRPWEVDWALEAEHLIGDGPTRVIRFSRKA
jgi:16S rRNA (guanine527-N7)-methyltransferase